MSCIPRRREAAEGAVHVDKDHVWHMESIAAMVRGDTRGVFITTPYRVVDLTDEALPVRRNGGRR